MCSRSSMEDKQSWYSSRWVPVFAGMMVELCGGSIYIPSLYTSDLKSRFFGGPAGQSSIETLVFACNLGNWFPAAGFFQDSRFGGGTSTTLIACALTFVGYMGLWAWSAEFITPPFWLVWVFWFIWGHGSGWFDNAAVTMVAKNFPKQRGRAMGLIKAFYGLGGSVLTTAYNLFFFEETTSFLLFLAIFLSALGVMSSFFIFDVPDEVRNEHDGHQRRFVFGLLDVICLACFLMAMNVASVAFGTSFGIKAAAFLGSMVFMLSLLVLVYGSRTASEHAFDTRDLTGGENATLRDVTLGQAFRMLDTYLMFCIMFVGMGVGLVVLNNAGQMVGSLEGSQETNTILVSLMSVANCFGRIAYGVVPDVLSHRLSRPFFIAVNMVLLISGQLLLACASIETLFIGGMVAGFSYGGFWTLAPSMVADLFGTKNFASLYTSFTIAVSSGSLIFSTLLCARLYDLEAQSHPAKTQSDCLGPTCFRLTNFICAGAGVVGLAVAVLLHVRVKLRSREMVAAASMRGTSLQPPRG